MGSYRYLFGPVPSRRLGRSLGVDLLPPKTCSFNCVFCQLGRTPSTTLARREYVPVQDVLSELEAWLEAGGEADCITLAGSGEPTLHSRFGDVLRCVGERTACRRVLLTNGSLFWDAEVRSAAAQADIVKVSLSAWDDNSFAAINRPPPSLAFAQVVEGLNQFSREFEGELWVEVFAVPSINGNAESMERIAKWVNGLHAHQIHLNTAVRPPAEGDVSPASEDDLRDWATRFSPPAQLAASSKKERPGGGFREADLLGLIDRHPATVSQLHGVTGMDTDLISTILERAVGCGRLLCEVRNGETYYHSRSGSE